MNTNTENLKKIYSFCKSRKRTTINTSTINEDYPCIADCPLKRNCIESKKKTRYNDPRFVTKCVAKVERVLAKEKEEAENDPFAEVRD